MKHTSNMSAALFCAAVVCLLCAVTSSEDVLNYMVTEEVPVGTFVGNVATDAGLWEQYDSSEMQQFRYRFLEPSEESAFFSINDVSSVIQVAETIDRDALCPRMATCQISQEAAAVSPEGDFHVFSLTFTIQDTNDIWPQFASNSIVIEIPESAAAGSLYNLPTALDLDSTQFSIKEYTLSESDQFDLVVTNIGSDTTTVQLSLKSTLDREERDAYQVLLYAYDGGDPPHSDSLLVNVSVTDANDHGPMFPNTTVSISVSEGAPLYSAIAQLTAEDPDLGVNGRVTYALSSSNDATTLERFSVNPDSGDVILQGVLDFETRTQFLVIVEAKDAGINSQPGYCTLEVNVLDANDNPPEIIVNTLAGTTNAEVAENQAAGRFVAHVTVRDRDTGDGGEFHCVISDARFTLNPLGTTRYEVLTAQSFDRETLEEHFVDILCQDYGVPSMSSSRQIIVTITDVNDNPPRFSQSTYFVEMEENNYFDKVIMQVNASDDDVGRNGEVRYLIDDPYQDLVTVDFITGIIRANAIFDFEDMSEVMFRVVAVDNGNVPYSSTCTVSLLIKDTNDEVPVFADANHAFVVMENRPRGLEIGVVSATDADSELYNQIQYELELDDGSSDAFAVDPHSGIVRTTRELDRESRELYTLTILAVNRGVLPALSGSVLVTVSVLDENDNMPLFVFPSQHNATVRIASRTPSGSWIGALVAQDRDLGANGRLRYSILGGNEGDTFVVDPDTGELRTQADLSHLDLKVFEVLVNVQDHGSPQHTANAMLHIQVNSSIAYPGTGESILSPNNVTIVIALAVCSVIIIVVLIVAIALMRSRDHRKKEQRTHQYQLNIQRSMTSGAEVEALSGHDLDRSSLRSSNASHSHGKDSGFASDIGHITHPHNNGVTYVNKQYDKLSPSYLAVHGTQPFPPCTVATSNEFERPPVDRKRGSLASGGGGGTTTVPWELNIQNLPQQQQLQPPQRPGAGPAPAPQSDTDSAYSGDLSNADSGRGPSESGDHNSSAASQALKACRGAPPQRHPAPSKHNNNPYPNDFNKNKAVAPGRPRDDAKPPVPSRQGRKRAAPSACPRDTCLTNHPNPYWKTNRCHGHPAVSEDDGGSTTSGSYVVDTNDLDIDPSAQLWTSVTV